MGRINRAPARKRTVFEALPHNPSSEASSRRLSGQAGSMSHEGMTGWKHVPLAQQSVQLRARDRINLHIVDDGVPRDGQPQRPLGRMCDALG